MKQGPTALWLDGKCCQEKMLGAASRACLLCFDGSVAQGAWADGNVLLPFPVLQSCSIFNCRKKAIYRLLLPCGSQFLGAFQLE